MTAEERAIERAAQAIYDAPNGIDGDQIADMLYTDFRIAGPSPADCRAQTMGVCRQAAKAAIAAYTAALAEAAPSEAEVHAAIGEMLATGCSGPYPAVAIAAINAARRASAAAPEKSDG
jgi:hypothetical protein